MKENATLNVPSDVLQPIIEAHIGKAVIEALGNRDEILQKAVSFCMNVQVDGDGKLTNYNGKPWIAWAIAKCVQDAARKAISEFLEQHSEIIKKQLAEELRKKNSPIAKQLAEGMVGALVNPEVLKWRLSIDCGIGKY